MSDLVYTFGISTTQKQKQTKSLWLYIPLWLFFVYLYIQILGFQVTNDNNPIVGGMYFIQFGVHEASHLVFAFLPAVFVAAAGSFGEMTFTWLLAFAAFRAKAYFAGIFSLVWVTLAMTSAGNYMADARTQALPLIGAGPDPIHDWNFVFGQLGWLSADAAIGTAVRVIGDSIGGAGLLYGLVLIIMMALATEDNPPPPKQMGPLPSPSKRV